MEPTFVIRQGASWLGSEEGLCIVRELIRSISTQAERDDMRVMRHRGMFTFDAMSHRFDCILNNHRWSFRGWFYTRDERVLLLPSVASYRLMRSVQYNVEVPIEDIFSLDPMCQVLLVYGGNRKSPCAKLPIYMFHILLTYLVHV